MLTIDALHNETFIHEQEPRELVNITHTLTYLDLTQYEATDDMPCLPEKVIKLNYSLLHESKQSKYAKKYGLSVFDFENIFEADSEMISIIKPEEEEQQDEIEAEPEPIPEPANDRKKKGKKIQPEPPLPLPEISKTPEPVIDQLELRIVLQSWCNTVVELLFEELGVHLHDINFIGINPACQDIVADVFKDYSIRFYTQEQAALATFIFDENCLSGEKIAVFSFCNNYPCYYFLTSGFEEPEGDYILPFVKESPKTYFDHRLNLAFKGPIFTVEYPFVYPEGYRPLRFRNSIKQEFRYELKKIVKQLDCQFVTCDDDFSAAFEEYREPSEERVIFDLHSTCSEWNSKLKFKRIMDFKVKVLPVLRCYELLEHQPIFVKKTMLCKMYSEYFEEEMVEGDLARRQLVEKPDLAATVILTVKIVQDGNMDNYLEELFGFADHVKCEYNIEARVEFGVGKNFLQMVKSELAEEFIEEEEEPEEEVEENGKNAFSNEMGENDSNHDNEFSERAEDESRREHLEDNEDQVSDVPPEQPAEPNYMRTFLKEISAEFSSFESKTIGKNRIRYPQQDILCLVSSTNLAACEAIAGNLVEWLKTRGIVYSEVYSHIDGALPGRYIFGIDFVEARANDQTIPLGSMQFSYLHNSRDHSGRYVIFGADSCKQFPGIIAELKEIRLEDHLILTAGYYRVIDRDTVVLLSQLEGEADEYEEIEDVEEPEEAEEEPEEEKFTTEEERPEKE